MRFCDLGYPLWWSVACLLCALALTSFCFIAVGDVAGAAAGGGDIAFSLWMFLGGFVFALILGVATVCCLILKSTACSTPMHTSSLVGYFQYLNLVYLNSFK